MFTKKYTFKSDKEKLEFLINFSVKYSQDIYDLFGENLFPIREVFLHLQENFKEEIGEVYQRPLLTWIHGGDCDCNSVFLIAYLYYVGIPLINIELVEKIIDKKNGHLYVQYVARNGRRIILDPFPGIPYGESNKDLYQEIIYNVGYVLRGFNG